MTPGLVGTRHRPDGYLTGPRARDGKPLPRCLHWPGVLQVLVRRIFQEDAMAKKRKRKYSRGAGRDVESEMRRYKRGTARSGKGGRGGKVKSRKQAIAIGLSKARKKGKRVPKKK
jgi:hypothetical protein